MEFPLDAIPRMGRRRTLAEVIFRKSPESIRPSAETAQSWATSLNTLLNSKYGKNLFVAFLRKEYSEEYLEFYEAVEKYRRASSKRKLEKRAKHIIEEFVQPNASKEINIDHCLRSELMKATEVISELDHNLFDAVQNKVLSLLEAGSYRRFLAWSVYTDLLDSGSTKES